MAKGDRRPVHYCTATKLHLINHVWRTACKLKLLSEERAETVLTNDRELVTCRACRREAAAEKEE